MYNSRGICSSTDIEVVIPSKLKDQVSPNMGQYKSFVRTILWCATLDSHQGTKASTEFDCYTTANPKRG